MTIARRRQPAVVRARRRSAAPRSTSPASWPASPSSTRPYDVDAVRAAGASPPPIPSWRSASRSSTAPIDGRRRGRARRRRGHVAGRARPGERRLDLVHHGGGTCRGRSGAGRRHDPRPPVPRRTRSTSARLKLTWLRRRRAAVGAPRRRRDGAERVREGHRRGRPSATRPSGVVVVPHGLPAGRRRRRRRGRRCAPATACPAGRRVPGHHLPAQEPRRPGAGRSPAWRLATTTCGLVLLGGGGPAEAEVTAEIDRLGLGDRVVRPGRVPDADRDGLVRAAPPCWRSRAATRASAPGARGHGRSAARWSPPTPPRCPRWSATPAVLVDPDDAEAWAEAARLAARRRRRAPTASAPAGRRARRRVHRRARRQRALLARLPSRDRLRMKLAVLCPHFAPDLAPTGEVITRIVLELADRGHRLARRHGAALVPPPPRRAGVGGAGSCGTEATEWGSITRVHPFPTDKRSIPRRAVGLRRRSAPWPALPGLRGGRVDGVLAMSPPLTLGLTGWGMAAARGGPAGVQHPGRVPRRRRRARAPSPTRG